MEGDVFFESMVEKETLCECPSINKTVPRGVEEGIVNQCFGKKPN